MRGIGLTGGTALMHQAMSAVGLAPARPGRNLVPPAPGDLIGRAPGTFSGLPLKALLEPGARERVGATFLASDPQPPCEGHIRRPTVPLLDLFQIWTGRPIYGAARIDVPTLVIRGSDDTFADPTMIDRLASGCSRKEVIVGDATHYMLFERARTLLYADVDLS